jgi:UPF0755 protein
MTQKLIFYFKIFVFFLIGLFLSLYFLNFIFLAPPKVFVEGKIVSIRQGDSLRAISGILKEQNIIKSRVAFESFVIAFGGEKHLLPGDYLFESKTPVYEVARRMSFGKRNLLPIKVTIPEGFNINEIATLVSSKLPNFNQENFLNLAKEKEGYLFPDTYFFFNADDEVDVINIMSDYFDRKVIPLLPATYPEGEDPEEIKKQIIVMASIIEEEAKGDDDRALISGILWNRLSINMLLQVDAVPDTYKTKGLPAKPVSNPGLKAIQAALYPEASQYLFYLHGNDGKVHYAVTFTEHKKNISKYLK